MAAGKLVGKNSVDAELLRLSILYVSYSGKQLC